MQKLGLMVALCAFGAVTWLQASTAQAGIGSCGNIHVEAEAECQLVAPGIECEGMCTPLSVQAACAAQLAVECDGGCDELPSVQCSGECMGGCMAECDELEAGEFDCQGSCEADCSGSCEASCEAEDDSAACMAQCQGSCSASCEGSCDVELPEANCEAACEASCEGSCEVDANLDCQLECQSEGFAGCEAEIQGGCEIACEAEEGVLFCDSQYVDHGDNLQMCVDAIEAWIDANVMVEAEASGSSECTDEEGCMVEGRAEARVTTECSVGEPGRGGAPAGGLMLLGLLGLGLTRRRRR